MLIKVSENVAVNPKDIKFIQAVPFNKTKIVLDGHTIIIEEEMETVLKKINAKEDPVAKAILELTSVVKWKR